MATVHIESKKEDIAPIVLMPGDPKRSEYIAKNFLKDYKLVNDVRGMTAYTGYYKDTKITVFPSGMGCPSMGIYSYELFKEYGVEKIIRIGTCGSFNENIKLLDVILSTGAYCKSHFDELLDGVNVDFIQSSDALNRAIINKAKKHNRKENYCRNSQNRDQCTSKIPFLIIVLP